MLPCVYYFILPTEDCVWQFFAWIHLAMRYFFFSNISSVVFFSAKCAFASHNIDMLYFHFCSTPNTGFSNLSYISSIFWLLNVCSYISKTWTICDYLLGHLVRFNSHLIPQCVFGLTTPSVWQVYVGVHTQHSCNCYFLLHHFVLLLLLILSYVPSWKLVPSHL